MAKIVLQFPGQGSQAPGMGQSLYNAFPEAREIMDQANDILGFDLKAAMFNGTEEELRQTAVTQPAIFTVSAAAFKVLEKHCPSVVSQSAFTAGHSLGEYSALFAAGAFDFKTGLSLVKSRGLAIQDAGQKNPGTMAAVIGVDRDALGVLCKESVSTGECCEMVNFNCPGQIVVAGSKPAIEKLLQKLSTVSGARGIPLSVSGAFHSSLMNEAAQRMAGELKGAAVTDTRLPVYANCDAKPTTHASEIREKLVRQIDHPVLWEDSVRAMMAQGGDTFIELGPGKVLTGLLRKIDRKMKASAIEDADGLQKLLQETGSAVS